MTLGCVGSLGSGPVGAMPFGSGSLLAIVFARESTLNSVDVTFNVDPRAGDPGDVRDATNPANWTLVAVDPPTSTVRLPQTMVHLSEGVVRVYFDGPLDPFVTYRIILNPRVTTPSGAPLAPTGCADWLFATFGWPRQLRPEAARSTETIDVANPFLPSDAPSPTSPLGTFQIDDTGDLANDRDRQNLRKRVLRRAMTVEGGFFHMPTYGFGQALKSLAKTDLLRRIQNAALQQIKLEPDVLTVAVEASSPVPGIVRLLIRVTDRYGRAEQIIADLPRPG